MRYGRRRRRNREWGGGTGGGMARAPPGPSGERARFPLPNQPVPPFGRDRYPNLQNRYPGPQPRSYASVVRGGNPRPARSFIPFQTWRARGNERHVPTDPKFGKLVRKFHAIIKVVHHLQNVAPKPDKPEPRMISRMVDMLASMIKPASPTAETADLIRGNANNWGYTTLLILEDHYKAGLETMLVDLDRELIEDWRPAFEVAKRWARRNLPRVTQEVLDHAEALITSRKEPIPDVDVAQEAPAPLVGDTETVQATGDGQRRAPAPPEVRTQQTRKVAPETAKTTTVATMTERVLPVAEPAPEPRVVVRTPERVRQQRDWGVNGCVITGESDLLELSEETSDPRSQRRPIQKVVTPTRSLLDEGISEVLVESPWLVPIQHGGTPARETSEGDQHEVLVHVPMFSDDEESSGEISLNLTSTPKSQMCRPTRHQNTDRKMIDWHLRVQKKWLILGDSNLARIPGYAIPDLQIESYPGANFRHAQALMEKSLGSNGVEKLVLSFGLNCRAQKAKETSVKQMQAAVRTAKKRFPHSEIWIPEINYSSYLPEEEQGSLRTLNAHIRRNLPYIPALDDARFVTDWDDVHWTKETGSAMLEHWAACLNFHAP